MEIWGFLALNCLATLPLHSSGCHTWVSHPPFHSLPLPPVFEMSKPERPLGHLAQPSGLLGDPEVDTYLSWAHIHICQLRELH